MYVLTIKYVRTKYVLLCMCVDNTSSMHFTHYVHMYYVLCTCVHIVISLESALSVGIHGPATHFTTYATSVVLQHNNYSMCSNVLHIQYFMSIHVKGMMYYSNTQPRPSAAANSFAFFLASPCHVELSSLSLILSILCLTFDLDFILYDFLVRRFLFIRSHVLTSWA